MGGIQTHDLCNTRAVSYQCWVLSLFSSALALGATHHHLIKTRQRLRVGLIVETGEAREMHHMCLLLGYGADAICPYLVYESVQSLRDQNLLGEEVFTDEEIALRFKSATAKGIAKVMAKMGISTLHSYKVIVLSPQNDHIRILYKHRVHKYVFNGAKYNHKIKSGGER